MTSKLIQLIESELPEFFNGYCDKEYFKTFVSLEVIEELIENYLCRIYPKCNCYPVCDNKQHQQLLGQRNRFRTLWNDILTGNIAK